MGESDTVFFVNGRCYSCGGTARMSVRRSWCRGCGAEVGTIGWEDEGTLTAARINRLAAAYDAGMGLAGRRLLAAGE